MFRRGDRVCLGRLIVVLVGSVPVLLVKEGLS